MNRPERHLRVGVALEAGTSHIAACMEKLDFIEYGYHANSGVPQWVEEMAANRDMVLHPLDVNVGQAELLDKQWLETLARDCQNVGATACVTDGFYWYHGDRQSTWPRPVDFRRSGEAVAEVAAVIQETTALPFRVENPPVEWMPGTPSVWSFFESVLNHQPVSLCLDLSHLLQFEWNIHRRLPILPRFFPWEAIGEVHLSGYLAVEIDGQRVLIDQHDTPPCDHQFKLLDEVIQHLPDDASLDICLEMEPHNTATIDHNIRKLRSFLENC